MDSTRLDTLLAELGDSVAFPDTPDFVDGVLQSIATSAPDAPVNRAWHRWPRIVAAAAVVAAAVLIAVPGPRRAIASLLGLGGVDITIVEQLPVAPATGEPTGVALPLDDARAAVDFSIHMPEGFGEPAAVWVDPVVPGGLVTLAYQPSGDGYGLVITQMRGAVEGSLLQKLLGPDSTLSVVEVAGDAAYWIEGEPHLLAILDETGKDVQGTPRLVGTTLLFERDGLTIRIESALDLDAALEIVDSLKASSP